MRTEPCAQRAATLRAPHTLLALATLAGALAVHAPRSQGAIFIVDEAGGAGAHFADIPAAVAAAQAGDSIVVRPGTYSGFVVDKGVAVLGQPGARIGRPQTPISLELVSIRGVPAGARCTVAGLRIDLVALLFSWLDVRDCAGAVSLEDLVVLGNAEVTDCAQVTFRRCSMGGAGITSTTGALHDCVLTRASYALRTAKADVELSRCTVTNTGGGTALPRAAVLASSSVLTITGDGSGGYTASPTNPGPAIEASSDTTIWLDDHVPLFPSGGSPPISAGTTHATNIPSLSADAGPIGGTVTVDLSSEPQDLFFLFVGFPGQPLAVPGLQQRLWVDPAFLPLIRAGVLDASARLTFSVRTPNAPSLVGVPLMWQAVAGQLPTLGFSNAPVYVHGL